jgi:hypothetical protein
MRGCDEECVAARVPGMAMVVMMMVVLTAARWEQ